ncbi:Zinc finger, CCCH-type [Phaffia rhodozyma]|uniref:Zinc finger, CCCH-type n=1 Tax=Phaffia rhodozyma TaxID=264483 RepID=A0A0F7SJ61_PHARH|nr:Zinc finger, CCCH-type [Phaffia rhodozyma]
MHHSLPQRPSGQPAPDSSAAAPPPRLRSNLPSNLPSNPTLLQHQSQPQPQPQSSSSYPHQLPNLPAYPAPITGPIYSPSGFNLASLAASNALQALSNPNPNVWAGSYPSMNNAYSGHPLQPFGYPSNPYQQTPQGYTLSTHFTSQPVSSPSAPSSSSFTPKSSSSISDHPHPTAGRSEKKAKQPKLDHQALNPAQRMRNCQLSSCHFTGLEKDVEIHEMDRHLIYPVGWKEKMERKKAKSNGGPPVPIPGTTMVLQTPEQIEAWIAERKRKWPTQARVQEKEKMHEEAVSRGELPFRSASARGRGRGGVTRGRGNTRNQLSSSRPQGKKPSENRPAKPGSKGRGVDLEAYEKAKKEGLLDDDFDSDPLSSSSSSSSSEDEDSSSEEDESSSDEDGPPEGSSSKLPTAEGEGKEGARAKPVCSYFRTKKGCKMGNACRFAHQNEQEDPDCISNPNALRPTQQPRPTPTPNPRIQPRPSTRPSLLHSLLETDIQHTTSDLSQVIHFLCTNDFLRGVERHVGEREERLRSGIGAIEHDEEENSDNEKAME